MTTAGAAHLAGEGNANLVRSIRSSCTLLVLWDGTGTSSRSSFFVALRCMQREVFSFLLGGALPPFSVRRQQVRSAS